MQGSSAERKEFDAYWRGVGDRYNCPGWGNVSVGSSVDVANPADVSGLERPVLTVRDKVSQAFNLSEADEDE